MNNPMRERSHVETKRGICCFKFVEIIVGLNMGMRVPMTNVLEALKAAEKCGIDPKTGFFVALAAGHRIHEHGDTLEAGLEFAARAGVPDMQVKTRQATAADVVNDCDINRELSMAIVGEASALPDDVAAEVHAMAKTANLPEGLSDAQVIVALHSMKHHGDSLEEAVRIVTKDSGVAQATRAARSN